MARDVADRDRDAAVVEDDHVVPVAADPRVGLGGQIAGGHGESGDERERGRQQASLERLDDASLVLVAAGVANRQRRAVGEQAEQRDLLRAEVAPRQRADLERSD